jgi:predicted acylesterase/phospholipase RssA
MSSGARQVRLSVSLSGGAALGAYHAGVLAALATAVQAVRAREAADVRIDAIGGASAGALAAMFASHALANGLDAVEVLSQAWVEQVSLGMLQEDGTRAPLGFDELRRRLPSELAVHRWTRSPAGPQPSPVGLHVSLTGLRGLRYRLEVDRDRTVPAVTYADWGEFTLQPEGGVEQLLTPEDASVIDFVLASAAHPAAFPAQLLDRSHDKDAFRARNIERLPAGGRLWYTDGSSISSEPLGRVLSIANSLDDRKDPAAPRVALLVDPLSETPEDDGAWTADGEAPSWLDGLTRTLEIMPEQVLHDDLRRVQHVNDRFARLDRFVEAIAPYVDDGAAGALREAFGDEVDIAADASAPDAVRAAAERVGGLDGKVPVHLDLISPMLLTERHDRAVPGLLAGEVMGDFGGFLHRRLRRSDFALGYECLEAWLGDAFVRAGLSDAAVEVAASAVRTARPAPWKQVEEGHTDVSDLPREAAWRLARLGLHTLRVVAAEVWRSVRP